MQWYKKKMRDELEKSAEFLANFPEAPEVSSGDDTSEDEEDDGESSLDRIDKKKSKSSSKRCTK